MPLSSATSPVVRVMIDGSMPPPAADLPPSTEADIGSVVAYIDNPRFWPGVPPAAADAGAAPALDAGADSR